MTSPQWCVSRDSDFLIRDWDADGVLYDVASGDTHRLGAMHLEVLELLKSAPQTCERLHRLLAADLPEHLDGPEQLALVERAVGDLAGLGLIEARPS